MTQVETPKMAILQTGRSVDELIPTHGDYDDMCKIMMARAPEDADTYAVLDGQFPDDITAYDVLVITGSKFGAYEDHPWIPPLEALIREAMDAGVKLIGVCFGHQIIAQALGGKVAKSDKGWGAGVMDYELQVGSGAPCCVALYAWHQDQVVKAPEGAEVIARSDFCEFAGLRYGDTALTFQAHPEFTKAFLADLAEARKGSAIPAAIGDAAIASLSRPVDAGVVTDMMMSFITDD